MNFWNVHVCEMRNFKSVRRQNSLSVYLFKIQCSCATIGPTGLQVRSLIAFSITLLIVICLVHIIATWNKCQTSIDQHAMFPLIGDQYTTFSLILWRQFIWNTAKVRVVYSIKRALETLCYVLKWLFRFKLVRYRLISNCAQLKSQAYRQLVCRSQFIVDLSFIFQCCVWSFFLIL